MKQFLFNNPKYILYALIYTIMLVGIIINITDFLSQPLFIIIVSLGIMGGSGYYMFNNMIQEYKNGNSNN